jgi:hypothetical protein
MSNFTFNQIAGTENINYNDMQYFNQTIYCCSTSTSPFISYLVSDVITSISTDNALVVVTCLAIYSTQIIYCGDSNGNIWRVIAATGNATNVNGIPDNVNSMTIDSNILYFANNTTIYTIDISNITSTPTALPYSFDSNIQCIRFFNNILYVSCDHDLYTINSSTFSHVITNCPQFISGIAMDINNNLYIRSRTGNGDSNLYRLSTNQLISVTTNLPTNNTLNTYIIFDINNVLYTTYLDDPYGGLYKSTSNEFCFNKGTKILCMNQQLEDEYVVIEDLKVGDFVKTFKHGYRKVIKTITGSFVNNPKKWNICMYKMAKTESNGLLEDLIVTGGHSLLVDSLSDAELSKYEEMGIPDFANQTIDKKHLVLSCVSDQFTPMPDTERYQYYHLLLENNDDEEERFGIWANGVLTETPNEKTVK